MAAYCLFDNLEIFDQAKMEEYRKGVMPVVQQFGGRYVVVGGKVDLMEGTAQPSYPVMIEFPSLEQAHRWYGSEEYRELKSLRLEAGRFNAVFVEGL
jgi:uncharacterized protein (DUF1330 family)